MYQAIEHEIDRANVRSMVKSAGVLLKDKRISRNSFRLVASSALAWEITKSLKDKIERKVANGK